MSNRKKFGEFDATPLHEAAEKLGAMASDWDAFMQEAMNFVLDRLDEKLQVNTPVNKGALRMAWRKQSVEKRGDDWIVVMVNSKDYATYVNDGHRTREKKVFSKGDILAAAAKGEAPHKDQRWVEGQFYVEDSVEAIEIQLPDIFETKFEEFKKKHGWG